MTQALHWERLGSGEWHLYDKPRGQPRHEIGTITGFAKVAFNGSLKERSIGEFRGKTVQGVKRQMEAALAATPSSNIQ